jgi:hypothetical protein
LKFFIALNHFRRRALPGGRQAVGDVLDDPMLNPLVYHRDPARLAAAQVYNPYRS